MSSEMAAGAACARAAPLNSRLAPQAAATAARGLASGRRVVGLLRCCEIRGMGVMVVSIYGYAGCLRVLRRLAGGRRFYSGMIGWRAGKAGVSARPPGASGCDAA